MADEGPGVVTAPTADPVPSETSPLLRSEAETSANGTFSDEPVKPSTGSTDTVSDEVDGPAAGPSAVAREGMPELAAKMPILIPAIGIGVFLSALDQLLVVATYARVGSELNALNNTSWIATAYFLTLTSFQPLYGKLSDIFGRKECLLFAYVVFGLGCLGCGLAQDIKQLIIARAVAGVGGGGMNAVVSILLTDIVPLRDRGVWQGYINIIFAAGTSSGAPLGGLLADSVGWRWSFIGQTPLCLAAFLAVYLVLDLPPPSTSHWLSKLGRVDFLGAFTLVSAVFALLLGLDNGSNRSGWTHRSTLLPLCLSPFLFAAFVLVEKYVAKNPFAPGRIIFHRRLFGSFMANFWGVAGQMPTIFYLPLLYQAVHGLSAVQSGLLLIPGSVAGVSASLGGGFVIRRTGRYYWVTVAAYVLQLLSVVPMVVFTGVMRSKWGTVAGFVITSLGAGCGITTTLIALISNSPRSDMATVVACSYLFRSLGSSIGISVQSAVLQQVLRTQLARRLDGSGEDAARIEERVRQSLDYIKELEPGTAAAVRSCYQVATMVVFGANGVFLALAVVAAVFMKEKVVAK